jgi:hypothetical protein
VRAGLAHGGSTGPHGVVRVEPEHACGVRLAFRQAALPGRPSAPRAMDEAAT